MPTLTPAEITRLSVADKLKLIDLLWDSIVDQEGDLPVPEWQLRIIEERVQRHKDNPSEGLAWSEVRRKLEAKRKANARTGH